VAQLGELESPKEFNRRVGEEAGDYIMNEEDDWE
jgi:hypothetical protein